MGPRVCGLRPALDPTARIDGIASRLLDRIQRRETDGHLGRSRSSEFLWILLLLVAGESDSQAEYRVSITLTRSTKSTISVT